jgi:hypothetical protein
MSAGTTQNFPRSTTEPTNHNNPHNPHNPNNPNNTLGTMTVGDLVMVNGHTCTCKKRRRRVTAILGTSAQRLHTPYFHTTTHRAFVVLPLLSSTTATASLTSTIATAATLASTVLMLFLQACCSSYPSHSTSSAA